MDAKAWDERYSESELVWSVEPNQFVAAECADLPPGRALDLAAGEGRNSIWLARRGWVVTAVDFSQAGLEKGRRLAGEVEIDWVCGDVVTGFGLDKLDHRGGLDQSAYDLCVIAYLQLVAEERRAAVRRGFASLTQGGTFLLVAHDTTNLTEGTGGPQDVTRLMTAQDILEDLADAEYDVVHADRVERVVVSPDEGSLTAWDALVRLVRRA